MNELPPPYWQLSLLTTGLVSCGFTCWFGDMGSEGEFLLAIKLMYLWVEGEQQPSPGTVQCV